MAERTNGQSRLLTLATTGRRLTPVWLVIPLTIVVVLGSVIMMGALGERVILALLGSSTDVEASATRSGLASLIEQLFTFGPIILFVALWVSRFEGRPVTSIGFERPQAGPQMLRGAFFGLLMMSLWTVLALALGGVELEAGLPSQQGLAALGGVLLALLARSIQAPAEEVLFRGWVLPVLGVRLRPWAGVLIASVLFGAIHAGGGDRNLIALINIGLFGIFLALYALYEGGLWGVCAWHTVYNWAQFNLFGFDVTPETTAGGAIVNLRYTDANPFVTTGAVAEDGLLMTCVLGLGLLVLTGLMLRRPRHSAQAVRGR